MSENYTRGWLLDHTLNAYRDARDSFEQCMAFDWDDGNVARELEDDMAAYRQAYVALGGDEFRLDELDDNIKRRYADV